MAKLSIKTKDSYDSVFIIGDFNDWQLANAKRVDRKKRAKFIVVEDMPVGQYRVYWRPFFNDYEKYPYHHEQEMSPRYFGGEIDEVICCYF